MPHELLTLSPEALGLALDCEQLAVSRDRQRLDRVAAQGGAVRYVAVVEGA